MLHAWLVVTYQLSLNMIENEVYHFPSPLENLCALSEVENGQTWAEKQPENQQSKIKLCRPQDIHHSEQM